MTYFDIAWGLLIIKDYLRIADYINIPDRLDDIFVICVCGIFCISIISKKYNIRELFIYVVVGGCALYTGLISGYMLIPTTVLSVIAVKDENLRNIAKKTFKLQIILLVFNTFISGIATVWGNGALWGYTENGKRFRIHLGYGMAGHLADCILNLLCMWIYIHDKKITDKQYAFMTVIALITFLMTDSRTVFILMVFVIVGAKCASKRDIYDKIIRSIVKIVAPGCTMIMLGAIYLYANGNKVGYLIDRLTNSRVRLCGYNLDRYGITLFGQYCENGSGTGDLILKWLSDGVTYDNAYMWMVINMGIIWILIMTVCMIRVSNQGTSVECLLLIACALGAMMDTSFVNSACCFSVMLMGQQKWKHKNATIKMKGIS